ncbi:MAG: hypothetical protein ACRDRT_13645, partial [Pseudonocardiaceae bacterium]
MTIASLELAAQRLAVLLNGGGSPVADRANGNLVFEADIGIRPLEVAVAPPPEVWAVDGGQALVADARCLQVFVARAARVCFRDGSCVLEDEGVLRAWLLGGREDRVAAESLGLGIAPEAAIDVNLLRDHEEWQAVRRSIADASPGSVVLVDGDLEPDWRIPADVLVQVFQEAVLAGVHLAGVVKRSALARRGAPLVGQLELEAEALLGPRARWWAPVAWVRGTGGAYRRVVVAKLDPDARFAFRIDLAAGSEATAQALLGVLARVSNDAAF